MKHIIAETMKLIPTQPALDRDIIYNLYQAFDESRFEAPYVLRYDSNLLIVNGHHRVYVKYLRNEMHLGVDLIENEIDLREALNTPESLDEFVQNYLKYTRPYFERLEIYDISDLKKKLI